MPKHALVIGGTGMLKDVSLQLLDEFDTVSVIARGTKGFDDLKKAAGKNKNKISVLRVDYNNYMELTQTLTKSIRDSGAISLAISWVHSTAPLAAILAAKIINETSAGCDFYELLGSIYADPNAKNINREEGFKEFRNISYRKIILGYVPDSGGSRWLSNAEISSGFISAVHNNLPEKIVGAIEPWDKKP